MNRTCESYVKSDGNTAAFIVPPYITMSLEVRDPSPHLIEVQRDLPVVVYPISVFERGIRRNEIGIRIDGKRLVICITRIRTAALQVCVDTEQTQRTRV